jgi:subtilisin family serine protease
MQIALSDPAGAVYPLDLSAASTHVLQATYVVPIARGSRIDGEWSLTVANYGDYDAWVLQWAMFADRRVFQEDLNGHGTHVAGTAAGNGRTYDGPTLYAGVAPEADLLIVRGTRELGIFATDDIVAGIQWVDATASSLRQPVVLNMSLGGSIGPHDGTGIEDKAVDSVVGPGRVGKAIVVANGNEGDTPMHASGTLAPGGGIPFEVVVPEGEDGVGYTWAYVAVEGTGTPSFGIDHPFPNDFECYTYVYDSTGTGVDPRADCAAIGRLAAGTPIIFELFDTDGASATVGTITWERGDRAHLLSLEWYDTDWYWVIPGEWHLGVRGLTGRWDGWQPDCMPFVSCDTRMTVGSPGSANRAISVGAYNTRTTWTDSRSIRHDVDEEEGALSSFSSRGPTRDGRVKPEITAPGQKIISARSWDRALCPYVHPIYCQVPELGWEDDVSDYLLALQGTSMASPMVAGSVALLLELDPRLDAARIKQILMDTARTDSHTGARPNPEQWGAGKIDVRAAAGVVGVPPRPSATATRQVTPGPTSGPPPLQIFMPHAIKGVAR